MSICFKGKCIATELGIIKNNEIQYGIQYGRRTRKIYESSICVNMIASDYKPVFLFYLNVHNSYFLFWNTFILP